MDRPTQRKCRSGWGNDASLQPGTRAQRALGLLKLSAPAWQTLCPPPPSGLPWLHWGLSWVSLLPRTAPRQRRFSLGSRLKRRGDAPRGRSGRRAGRFQVPGPGLQVRACAPRGGGSVCPRVLTRCAQGRAGAVLAPRAPGPALGTLAPTPPLATPKRSPRPLPGSASPNPHPQLLPRLGPKESSYLPRGL